jgi:hypothetical protein
MRVPVFYITLICKFVNFYVYGTSLAKSIYIIDVGYVVTE